MTDTEAPDLTQLATSFVPLIQRFTGNQPDALVQLRLQIERERDAGKQMVERAEAQLAAIEQLEALIATEGQPESGATSPLASFPAPPLKTAFLRILNEDSSRVWDREDLYAEVDRRGWGPRSGNRRNTLTSRLRELEREELVKRVGDHGFASIKSDGASAV